MRLSAFKAAAAALFPVLALSTSSAWANELVNVYRLAADNDAQIAAAAHQRDAALEARPQARAALLPLISGSYSYGKGHSIGSQEQISEIGVPITDSSGNPVDADGDGRQDTELRPTPIGRRFNTNDTNKNLNISLTQPLFDWASFLRLSKSADQLALAQASFRAAEQNLLLRSAQAYFNYLAANDDLRYTGARKASLERQLEQAKKRFDVGLSAITDVQEAQASYDVTTADVIAAEQALASAREALLEVTGQQDARLVALQEEIPLPGPQPEDMNAWLSSAKDNNFDLAIARINAELAGRDVDIARAGHYPTLSLVGQYTDISQDSKERKSEIGDFYQENRGPSVAVQVNVPIFSGFLVNSQTRQAANVEDQRKAELLGSQRSVARQTRDAYLKVLSGSARVKALKQAVISNQTALQASETGLEVGTRTTVDVLNAQSLLFSAQRDYARARYDYLVSILTLKSAAGRLTESDLAEIDQLLVSG
ncbi:TolC family outer membrane protein [Hydrocarboniphaga effusa]|jgi:outer membrane protein|uniref:TolC family outer membrane protein n=1 Tax=Hydrocarboniphaga effusa TaxID=243629 RepID=UPI003137B847